MNVLLAPFLQAAERAAAAALAPAPASTVAEAAGAPTYVVYVGSAESASAPGFSPAGGPASSMYAAQVPTILRTMLQMAHRLGVEAFATQRRGKLPADTENNR